MSGVDQPTAAQCDFSTAPSESIPIAQTTSTRATVHQPRRPGATRRPATPPTDGARERDDRVLARRQDDHRPARTVVGPLRTHPGIIHCRPGSGVAPAAGSAAFLAGHLAAPRLRRRCRRWSGSPSGVPVGVCVGVGVWVGVWVGVVVGVWVGVWVGVAVLVGAGLIGWPTLDGGGKSLTGRSFIAVSM